MGGRVILLWLIKNNAYFSLRIGSVFCWQDFQFYTMKGTDFLPLFLSSFYTVPIHVGVLFPWLVSPQHIAYTHSCRGSLWEGLTSAASIHQTMEVFPCSASKGGCSTSSFTKKPCSDNHGFSITTASISCKSTWNMMEIHTWLCFTGHSFMIYRYHNNNEKIEKQILHLIRKSSFSKQRCL